MRRLVLAAGGRLELEEVPEPVPGPGEVLVRAAFCGVCGSDLGRYREATGPIEHWGHELVGRVTAVGERADSSLAGRAVAARTSAPCGACAQCVRGRMRRCTRWTYHRFNGFAESVALPARLVVALPEPLEVAHALVEPLYVAHDLVARAALEPGDRALVVGAGPLGLMALRRLQLDGIESLFAFTRGRTPARGELAARWGATVLAGPAPEAGLDCDAAIVTAPYPVLPSVPPAVAFGGRIVFNGITERSRVALDMRELHTRRIDLRPSFPHPQPGFEPALAWLREDAAALGRLITHRVALEEAPEAVRRLADGSLPAVKLVVDLSGGPPERRPRG